MNFLVNPLKSTQILQMRYNFNGYTALHLPIVLYSTPLIYGLFLCLYLFLESVSIINLPPSLKAYINNSRSIISFISVTVSSYFCKASFYASVSVSARFNLFFSISRINSFKSELWLIYCSCGSIFPYQNSSSKILITSLLS